MMKRRVRSTFKREIAWTVFNTGVFAGWLMAIGGFVSVQESFAVPDQVFAPIMPTMPLWEAFTAIAVGLLVLVAGEVAKKELSTRS